MLNTQLQDAREVHAKAHDLVNTLVASGISEQAAVVGTFQALVERVLLAGGTKETARWLRDQAGQVEKTGDEFLRALNP